MNIIEFGDCREIMARWTSEGVKVQTCITSPPYFGLRDYGHERQIGLEDNVGTYVSNLVDVFSHVWNLLADDGTLWLNLGDSYAGSGKGSSKGLNGEHHHMEHKHSKNVPDGLKPKDLIGVPWRVAFALQDVGWYLRQDIIWHKPNPMPESVTDRCTKSHEYIFLLSKSAKYFYDYEAIQEQATTVENRPSGVVRDRVYDYDSKQKAMGRARGGEETPEPTTRNKRSVWTVTTKPFTGAHFATFPPDLIEPCVMAGSRAGDIVLDPFMGSGTTAAVADHLNRLYLGCELNCDYEKLQKQRLQQRSLDLI
jgi:DNA modification methylase